MNYTEPLSRQIYVFLQGLGFGVLLAVYYEAVVSVRRLISSRSGAVIFQDIFFSVTASVLSFFFMVIFNSGEVRLNIISAQLLGGLAFHFTLGKKLSAPFDVCGRAIRRLLKQIFSPAVKLMRFLRRKGHRIAERAGQAMKRQKNKKLSGDRRPAAESKRKKFENISKILLKKRKKSVY